MREFTYGFGHKPKDYILESADEITSGAPTLHLKGLEARLETGKTLNAKLLYLDKSIDLNDAHTVVIDVAAAVLRETYGKIDLAVIPDTGKLLESCKSAFAAFDDNITVLGVGGGALSVSAEQSAEAAALVKETDGITVGECSGKALYAAINAALDPEQKAENIAVILPD